MNLASNGSPMPRHPLFDADLHIINPQFPLEPNAGYLPPSFTVQDYQDRTAHLSVVGGAVVSGSFQGFDQTYLLDALHRLGPGFVGELRVERRPTKNRCGGLDPDDRPATRGARRAGQRPPRRIGDPGTPRHAGTPGA